jgi:hypothetical protein
VLGIARCRPSSAGLALGISRYRSTLLLERCEMYETVDGYTTSRPIHPPPKISKSQVSHLMTGNGTVGFGSATEFNARGASVSVGRLVGR